MVAKRHVLKNDEQAIIEFLNNLNNVSRIFSSSRELVNFNKSVHAEDSLLRYINSVSPNSRKYGRKKIDIFVFRLTQLQDNSREIRFNNAMPCCFCTDKLIKSGNVRYVYYTNDKGQMIKSHVNNLKPTLRVVR